METGRPVFVTPPRETEWNPSGHIGRKVALAWSGSPEDARAISFAMPFLREAEEVCIVFHGGEHGEPAGAEELHNYLGWHGIKTAVTSRASKSDDKTSAGESLLAQAEEVGADLLVMGAFTHSRLRQIIFGGTTRHVMEKSRISLLLAH